MHHVDGSRLTLAALGLLVATAALSACGSSRKVADGRPVCQRCHGGTNGNAAPPASVNGATATTDVKVGAHQAHLVAGRLRGPVPCGECHVVPADMQQHEAGIAAVAAGTAQRVVFGPLAERGSPVAAWSPSTERCSNTYCHGATLGHGGTNHEPAWTIVDAGHSEAACGTCHGFPPVNASHPVVTIGFPLTSDPCVGCHSQTVTGVIDASGFPTIDVAGGKHIDGMISVLSGTCTGGACTCCHGGPPTTGAHGAHVTSEPAAYGEASLTPTTATSYDFGCGSCHPLSAASHLNGTVDVTLDLPGAPAGSLRGLNDPAAAYDQVAGTCSGVYCHSTGQASPGYRTSPAWTSGSKLGCDGCHANPPNYKSGGAGAATANGHVGRFTFATDVIAAGHFAGLPAALHQGSAHGGGIDTQFAGDSAAPITCQTCHYATANPANTGPSGFYYLDTTGTYDEADAAGTAIVIACAGCHDGGAGSPAQGAGSVVPHFHVNGVRDVAFDPRTSLTVTTGMTLPGSPDAPTRPYWYTRATTNNISGTNSSVAINIASLTGGVLDGSTFSLEVSSAGWDPSTKTCSGVACHLNAANRPAIQWGEPFGTCSVCHAK
ncbi:MAG: CxxxxCH/CxxCH domain-containing protein [Anaeromyxobacteraceae bacterium]